MVFASRDRAERRRLAFMMRAEQHADSERFYRLFREVAEGIAEQRSTMLSIQQQVMLLNTGDPVPGGREQIDDIIAENRAEASRHERRLAYHATMRRKWERAARHPWLPVRPDPPPTD